MILDGKKLSNEAEEIMAFAMPDAIEMKYKDFIKNINYKSFFESLESVEGLMPLYNILRWSDLSENQRWERSLEEFRGIFDEYQKTKAAL